MRLSIGALAAVLAVATPALAQNHGSGHAGGSFSGGGHSYSGGHVSGGGSHAYAGGGRAMGGGPHLAPSAHYGGGYAAGYGHSGGYVGGYGHSGGYSHGGGTWGSGGWHGGNWGGGYHGGYWGGWHGGFWGGGYFHGGFWPRAYYGIGFPWFLPVLPLAYATYWWDGSPYYYANNVYYTWNPSYDGYVVTDPPPVNGGAAPESAAPAGASDQIFMYPRNGQSDAQLATDRNECQQWAGSQSGNGGGDDYRRAMTACAEARGYSTQ